MGLSSNEARVFLLTARQNDLELAMTTLTSRQQILATRQADAIAKKSQAMTQFIATQSADSKVSFMETAAYAEYEQAMNELEAADLRLTQELKAKETEHQAVTAELEEAKKLVDSNVKNSFGYFK